MEFCIWPFFCCAVLSIISSSATIFWWHVTVCGLCLFLTVPWVGLQCVIVVFPGHTHLLFAVCPRAKHFHLVARYCKLGFYFRETSHMRSFVKIKSSQNGESTLSFTDRVISYPSCEFLASQVCYLTLFAKIKLAKISGFTVLLTSHGSVIEPFLHS